MESLFLTAEFISMFSFVVIVYVAAIAGIFYRKAHLKSKSYEKAKYTYEFCLERHEILNKLFENMSVKKDRHSYDEILFDTYERRIIEVFNEISIGVNHGLLDESIVRPMFEGVFISFFKENKYLMYSAGDKLNNPYFFNEFQILTEKWEREPVKHKRFS